MEGKEGESWKAPRIGATHLVKNKKLGGDR